MNRRLFLPGALLWIAGLVLSIVGMNIRSDTGKLIAVTGNILFLIGLGIIGAVWMIRRKKEETKNREE